MSNEKKLSARYYVAEASVWLLGAVLLTCQLAGIAPGQTLPVINVVLGDERLFPRFVGFLIVATAVYMVVEWKQSAREARSAFWPIARITTTQIWALVSLWISWSLIVKNSRFENVSPVWYLGFIVLGFLVGAFIAILAFAALMIRTEPEAKRLRLPRVPAATRAQFLTLTPVIVVLLILYGVLFHFSPPVVKAVAFTLFLAPFLAMLGQELASLTLARDPDGNRTPFAKQVARFREIHDIHDYAHLLIDHGEENTNELGISRNSNPQDTQKVMQERFAQKDGTEAMHFRVQQQEECRIQFYPKDGNPKNNNPDNCGVKITKSGPKKGLLRVSMIPDVKDEETRDIEISVALVEMYAETYISTHTKKEDITLRELFSYAIDQTVIQEMMCQSGPLLHGAVNAGQIDLVHNLVVQDDVDINEKAAYGCTALLTASAQGYPEIVRILLEAGANPDLGNVHGITPLMYGARYGNTKICSILLEYEAELDLQDVYGMSALIVATRDGHQSIVELLVKAGADITLKTHDGISALDFAYASKHGKIAKILRQANKSMQATK